MNIFYVYEHWRLDTDTCFYVGKGKGGRAYSKQRNGLWKNIVAKLERSGFAFEIKIVASGLSEREAYDLEKERIAFWLDKVSLCNFTSGGEGWAGGKHSEEFKQRISARHKGKTVSGETRSRLSKSLRGNPRLIASRARFKHSDESKQKMRESFKGKPKSEDHKKKLSEANAGKKMTDEMRAILVAANTGRSPSEDTRKKIGAFHKGRPKTEEQKRKISESLKRRYADKKTLDVAS
jgi:hypothetical protein